MAARRDRRRPPSVDVRPQSPRPGRGSPGALALDARHGNGCGHRRAALRHPARVPAGRRAPGRPPAPRRVRLEVRRSGSEIDFGGRLIHIDGDEVRPIDLGPGRLSGEWVMVPRTPDAAEDDGWLLSYVYDRAADRSELTILAADDPAAGPVASIGCLSGCPPASTATGYPTGRLRPSSSECLPIRVFRRGKPRANTRWTRIGPSDELTTAEPSYAHDRRRRRRHVPRACRPAGVRAHRRRRAGHGAPVPCRRMGRRHRRRRAREVLLEGASAARPHRRCALVGSDAAAGAATPAPSPPCSSPSPAVLLRKDVRVDAEEVVRVVLLLDRPQAGRVRAVRARASAPADSSACPVKLVYVLPFP